MTLTEVGFYFRGIAWAVGLITFAWAVAPFIVDEWRARRRQQEKEEIDAYLDRIDPDLSGNGTPVLLKRSEQKPIIDPWKRY